MEIQKRLDMLEGSLEEANDGIREIRRELVGSQIDPKDKGFIGVVNDHEDRIFKMEKRWDKWLYVLIGFSAGTGYAIYDILNSLFKLITKK